MADGTSNIIIFELAFLASLNKLIKWQSRRHSHFRIFWNWLNGGPFCLICEISGRLYHPIRLMNSVKNQHGHNKVVLKYHKMMFSKYFRHRNVCIEFKITGQWNFNAVVFLRSSSSPTLSAPAKYMIFGVRKSIFRKIHLKITNIGLLYWH